MGASTFFTTIDGKDVAAAYTAAVEAAHYEHGHGGYTGTIAEKAGYTVISHTPHTPADADKKADELIEANDPRIADKWGPAAAIAIGEGRTVTGWLFFGWAST